MQIVRTNRYVKDLKRLGATDAEVVALEQSIVGDPTIGDVITALGGLRKARFGFGGRGKRGGGRVIYFLMIADDLAIMLFAYAKNQQEDLTKAQRREALEIMKEFNNG